MTVEVHFKLRQSLSETVLGSSLAGDGLLVRLRSTSIAMLATVAAIGLGLVAFASQIGWPEVFSGPIPTGPQLGVVRNDPIAAPRGERGARAARAALAARGNRSPARTVSAPSDAASVGGLAPSRQTGSSPAEPPAPDAPAPTHATPPPADTAPEAVPVTAPARPGGPPAEAPEPSPPAASPSSSPGQSGESHGHAPEAPPGQSGGGPPSWAANGDHGKSDGAGH
jgi:hypothetical protein